LKKEGTHSSNVWDIENSYKLHLKYGEDGYPTETVFSFTRDGKLGIGVDNPEAELHLSDLTPVLRLEKTTSNLSTWDFENTGKLHLKYGEEGYPTENTITFTREGRICGNHNLKLSGADDGSTDVYINTDGNVGIGTTNPTAKLNIVGNLGISRSVMIDSREIKFRGDGKAHFSIFANRIDNVFTIENTSSNFIPGISGSVLMAFNRNGNVGIGTTNPTAKLHIIGKAKITDCLWVKNEVMIQQNDPWPDYVFNNDYDLLPISELNTYIKANNHLPGIPSAEEIAETGIKLAKMSTVLLKKVEELTLYTIEQETKLEKQQDEIDKLKAQNSKIKELEAKIDALTELINK